MKFFEAQRTARRNTVTLAFLFVGTVLVLSVFNAIMLGFLMRSTSKHTDYHVGIFDVKIFFVSILVFVAVALYFLSMSPSSHRLAILMGGRKLDKGTTDQEKRLLNVVEEMAIASGAPIPHVYVLDHEEGINAFAAGTEPGQIVLGVTKGTMTLLSRDELQGVIGHEFSHVLNEDMKLNMRLAAVVMAFLAFYRMGQAMLRTNNASAYNIGSSRKGKGSPFGIALLVFGAIGYVLGRFIQSFISQQREYLADASSAQFTRNPESLARALAKINMGAGSTLMTDHNEYAHIFFAEGFISRFSEYVSSHPPLTERIQKLVPNRRIEEVFNDIQLDMIRDPEIQKVVGAKVERTIDKAAILASIGAPTAQNVFLSDIILDKMRVVRGLIQDVKTARGALALITFKSQPNYEEAKQLVKAEFPSAHVFEEICRLVEDPDVQVRITLFHFTLATLRYLSASDKVDLLTKMEEVFQQDKQFNLTEVLLYINAKALLLPAFRPVKSAPISVEEILNYAFSPENVELEKVANFIQQNKDISLIQKKEHIDKILEFYLQQNRLEELRLLCLALKVPVPPF
jgi:Zn-dependent protease with chaperone function